MDNRKIDQIKKSIISKNGTTDVALKTMDKSGFRRILDKAITSAINKAKKLGA